MSAETALERVVHLLAKTLASPYKTAAFERALEVVRRCPEHELVARAANATLADLDGIGPSTAGVISDALNGQVPRYLAELERDASIEVSAAAAEYVAALRGDCHLHSRWSDGADTIKEMAETAARLGHEYIVVTDHSARLTVAHGLDAQRLAKQIDEIESLNTSLRRAGSSLTVLCGMEVDIHPDGSLDMTDEMLERLDIVVASVHSKLKMDKREMTERMVAAVAHPQVDILGHCTGRKVGKRPPSAFDADYVFAACAQFGTAVELNCRPERQDPPEDLIAVALEHGCKFSIDTDAHATGQLEWQPLGAERAAACGIGIDNIINTLPAEALVSGRWH